MQLDNMSNTVRIFLVLVWNVPNVTIIHLIAGPKKQFYEMAAFTEGAGNLRRRGADNLNTLNRFARVEQRRYKVIIRVEPARFVTQPGNISDMMQVGLSSLGKARLTFLMIIIADTRPGAELKALTIFWPATELNENLESTGSRSHYMQTGCLRS